MKARLTRISNGQALRTNTVEGDVNSEPKVGTSFEIFSKPLTIGASFRYVTTSEVKSLEPDGDSIKFTTISGSVYLYEPVSEMPTPAMS